MTDCIYTDRNSTSNSTLRYIFHFLCVKKRAHTIYAALIKVHVYFFLECTNFHQWKINVMYPKHHSQKKEKRNLCSNVRVLMCGQMIAESSHQRQCSIRHNKYMHPHIVTYYAWISASTHIIVLVHIRGASISGTAQRSTNVPHTTKHSYNEDM